MHRFVTPIAVLVVSAASPAFAADPTTLSCMDSAVQKADLAAMAHNFDVAAQSDGDSGSIASDGAKAAFDTAKTCARANHWPEKARMPAAYYAAGEELFRASALLTTAAKLDLSAMQRAYDSVPVEIIDKMGKGGEGTTDLMAAFRREGVDYSTPQQRAAIAMFVSGLALERKMRLEFIAAK